MLMALLITTFLSAAHADSIPVTEAPPAAAEAATPAAARENAILKKYSLEELNSAATYLLAVFEASLDGKKAHILKCDPQPEIAQMWLSGPIHALIDEKSAIEAKALNTDAALAKVEKKWSHCADTCQCSSYLGITEQLQTKTPQLEKLTALLTEANKQQSAKASAKCAKKITWFCKSALRAYLKSNRDS